MAATRLRVWRNSGETQEIKMDGWFMEGSRKNFFGNDRAHPQFVAGCQRSHLAAAS
jgi:hypothetical protein